MDSTIIKERNTTGVYTTNPITLKYIMVSKAGSANSTFRLDNGASDDSGVIGPIRASVGGIWIPCQVHFEKGIRLTVTGSTAPYVVVGYD